jgi:hypothetical protein
MSDTTLPVPWTATPATGDACWCATEHVRKGCPSHGPQPRERAVNCRHCHRLTWNLDVVCDPCANTLARMETQIVPVDPASLTCYCLVCNRYVAHVGQRTSACDECLEVWCSVGLGPVDFGGAA